MGFRWWQNPGALDSRGQSVLEQSCDPKIHQKRFCPTALRTRARAPEAPAPAVTALQLAPAAASSARAAPGRRKRRPLPWRAGRCWNLRLAGAVPGSFAHPRTAQLTFMHLGRQPRGVDPAFDGGLPRRTPGGAPRARVRAVSWRAGVRIRGARAGRGGRAAAPAATQLRKLRAAARRRTRWTRCRRPAAGLQQLFRRGAAPHTRG